MDRITATRVFVAIVEQGSLTRAANYLEMTSAMVSRYLTTMESWVNVRLIHRTTRKLSLTEAGHALFESCKKLIDVAEFMESFSADHYSRPRGRLRISTSHSFGEYMLIPALVEFQRIHPDIDYTIITSEKALDLATERIDLAIRITDTLEQNVIAKFLACFPASFFASPRYLKSNGTPQTPSDLKSHKFITHSLLDMSVRQFKFRGNQIDIKLPDKFSTNESVVMKRAALEGAGIAVLPDFYVENELEDGELIKILPEIEPDPVEVYAVYLSKQYQPLSLRLLIDFLVDYFSKNSFSTQRKNFKKYPQI